MQRWYLFRPDRRRKRGSKVTQSVDQISVIICAYTEKRWNELLAAVESVQHQTHPPKEIIVVVDHNPNLLVRVQNQLPDVIAIENKGQKGASGARNTFPGVVLR